MTISRLGAVVLCGGRGRRMGRCKAWLPIGSEPMLGRVVRLVGTVAGPIIVVAAEGQDLPLLPAGVLVVRDPVPEGGPLVGLTAGLDALPEGIELAYVTAVDCPLLVPRWVDRLVERIGPHDVAVPIVEGRRYPLNALYRPGYILPVADSLLRQGVARPLDLVDSVRSVSLDAEVFGDIDPELRTLRNVNTPEEYRRALADATGYDHIH
ncbi:molybdenum cofactor guanylyltransferase [soil metagenome]